MQFVYFYTDMNSISTDPPNFLGGQEMLLRPLSNLSTRPSKGFTMVMESVLRMINAKRMPAN